jgi:hypothetical protein
MKCGERSMVEHKNLPIDKVQLDSTNPRIQNVLEMYEELSENEIGLALGVGGGENSDEGGTTYSSLKAAIKCNGTLIQPIIVNHTAGGSYVVIEGNTRLFIYRTLHKENAPGDWSDIPCIVHEDLEQEKIDAIRLQAHLVGPRPWNPYAKGKYLHHLANIEHMAINQLEDYCGGRKREVETYIRAYSDMEEYYRPITENEKFGDFDESKFSAFAELQATKIKTALHANGKDETDFSKWVANEPTLFKRLDSVRQLPRIMANDEAFKIFEKQGSKEALLYLDSLAKPGELDNATIEMLATALEQKIRKMQLDEVDQIRNNPDGSLSTALFDLQSELNSLVEMLDDEH